MDVFQIFHDVRFAYADNPKALISLATAIIAFVAAGFLYYDILIAKRIRGRWRSLVLTVAFTKTSIGVFAVIRFFDALYDIAYLIEHPGVETTASQNLLILEIPLLGIAINMLVFILLCGRHMYQLDQKD